jgi:hypothetical protein
MTAADVFIIERHLNNRFGISEQDLKQELKQYSLNVEVSTLYNIPLKNQLELFAKSRSVIARHGAGLFWIIVMRHGSFVFEYQSSNWHYEMISNMCGLQHTYINSMSRKVVGKIVSSKLINHAFEKSALIKTSIAKKKDADLATAITTIQIP